MDAGQIITVLLQTLAAGGGAFIAVRTELRYQREWIRRVEDVATRAHRRIDGLMGK